MERISVIFVLVLLLLKGEILTGQSKAELEKQRLEAQEIIDNTARLLEETGITRQNNLEKLNIINQRLISRQNLISTIESEIEFYDNSIKENQESISELENELNETRDSYAQLIRIAYKHRFAHQKVMFILSAEDFNQAFRRYRYLQQYGKSRQRQITRIEELNKEIVSEIEELELQINEKNVLLEEKQSEENILSQEQRQQNSIVQDLRRKETELRNQIEQQKRVAEALQQAIEQLLKEEADIAKMKDVYELTPEEKIISDQFQENKGRLPWPIERGVVTGFFGVHPHPVLRGIETQNNGIDISTDENAEVMALFNGEVRQVRTVPGLNNVVLLRHGSFLTVYANLAHVYVRAGDKVQTKQLIGRVFSDSEANNKSVLHIEIWEENEKLNPLIWLSRQ